MEITNYGHACFKIIYDDVSIIFDPYQDNSVPGLELPNNMAAHYVFSSHDHFDHNAVNKVKIYPTDIKLDLTEVVLSHDKEGGRLRGKSIARVIRFPDVSICHMGDVGDPNEVLKHEELKNIDIVLCPINGFYTISAEEAVELKKKMNWKLIIPMHFYDEKYNSGYPDGNQLKIFKQLIGKNYLESYVYFETFTGHPDALDAFIFRNRKTGDNNNDRLTLTPRW